MNRSTTPLIGMYMAAIVAANVLVALFGSSVAIVNAFVFIALDLSSGDRLHEAWHGRKIEIKLQRPMFALWVIIAGPIAFWLRMSALIAAGSLLSWLVDGAAGPIALASFVAFAVSATLDRLVYSLLGARAPLVKMNGSNLVSAAADSILFPLLAFGWPLLWWVVLGQFVAKVTGGAIWAYILTRRRAALVEDRHAA